jgi:hypothetical protein
MNITCKDHGGRGIDPLNCPACEAEFNSELAQPERNRGFRNGRLAKEPRWPKRITKKYALAMAHSASVRFYLEPFNGGLKGFYSMDIAAESGNVLRKASR